MSFKFNWRFFDLEDLQARCQTAVTEAIAQTRRPPVIVEPMRATHIDFGRAPPTIAFHSVPSIGVKRGHIVFSLKYHGDANLTLETAIQANPLREPMLDQHYPEFVRPKLISALDSLVLPFRLTLKDLVLDTLIDVVYTKLGVVVNFHEEPLKSVAAETSLDMIPGVREMITGILKQQLTASFYEDVPESVWASTSPRKQPPDPWMGARRWSQHNKPLVRFASIVNPFVGPRSNPWDFQHMFGTLALNATPEGLQFPAAILSRSTLSSLRRERAEVNPNDIMTQEELKHLFATDLGSETASLASRSTLERRLNWKPRRRVISLRRGFQSPQPSQDPADSPDQPIPRLGDAIDMIDPSDHKTSQATTPQPTNRAASRAANRSASRSTGNSTLQVDAPLLKAPSAPSTPRLDAVSEYATTDFEDESDLDTLYSDTLSSSHLSAGAHRRFSTPSDLQGMMRKRGKARTSSMQPQKKSSLLMSPLSASGPRAHYPSTNDLMNK